MSPRESQFWDLVSRGPGCWLWKRRSSHVWGYVRFTVRGVRDYSHRWSYRFTRGRIPPGLQVLHSCDTPACVRPTHLFLGTQADNMADMERKGRRRSRGLPGERNPAAKLTASRVRRIRLAVGISQRGLARRFGVSRNCIRLILARKKWMHVA